MVLCILNQYRPKVPTTSYEKADEARFCILRAKYPKITRSIYDDVKYYAVRYHNKVSFICALINAESEFNPRAVSHKGAKGLCQIMPATAQGVGVKECFNPAENMRGGMWHYHKTCLRAARGDHALALKYYHAGHHRKRFSRGTEEYSRAIMQNSIFEIQ